MKKITDLLKRKDKIRVSPIKCDYTGRILGYVVDTEDIDLHIYAPDVYEDFFGRKNE